jgi:hypothetical protein
MTVSFMARSTTTSLIGRGLFSALSAAGDRDGIGGRDKDGGFGSGGGGRSKETLFFGFEEPATGDADFIFDGETCEGCSPAPSATAGTVGKCGSVRCLGAMAAAKPPAKERVRFDVGT